MKIVAASLLTQAIAWEDIVARVNSIGASWTAAVPERFNSLDDVKPLLGAFLPGDEHYEEPAVKEIAVTASDIPASFDAAEHWPDCTVIANVRDQSSCGTCWAFGSVESFESRACIASGKDIKYSPEDTGFCSSAGFGCSGGNSAWSWFHSSGVVTGGDYPDRGSSGSCLPYSLKPCAHHVPGSDKYQPCPSSEYPSPSCANACSESGYSKNYNSDKVKAQSSYSVRGVAQIQQEIMTNGPLYVAFTVYDDFPTYRSGVYHATSHNQLGGHAVLAVGWGTLNGEDYWKIKNSWNEQWGNGGHFLIRRGNNECGIESSVSGGLVDGTPVPPSPSPTPTPTPTPSPSPGPSGFCGGHNDQVSCEGDSQSGEPCRWCEKIQFCMTDSFFKVACNMDAVAV